MRNKRKVLALIMLSGALLMLTRRQSQASRLSKAERSFLRRATLLEAQQVPLYQLLGMHCEHGGLQHLAVGYYQAMETEAEHLRDLRAAGRRFGLRLDCWQQLGERFGVASGKLLCGCDPRVPLWVITRIERLAAAEYAKAGSITSDRALRQLYLKNQVDEEVHQAWTGLMLSQFHSPSFGQKTDRLW